MKPCKQNIKTVLSRTALYEVWRNMIVVARKETETMERLGIKTTFRCCDMFRDFAKFKLWARLEQGYEIGRDDQKIIARYDLTKPFEPGNCFFVEHKNLVKDIEYLKFETTKGASGVAYKDDFRKWNGQSNTRLYNIWKTTCRACKDPSQKDYCRLGAKGIVVDDLWSSNYLAFEDWAWEHGYTNQMCLTRIDKSKGFTPNNCRWETRAELNGAGVNKYEKVRLSVKRMKQYLEQIDELAICTLIIAPRHFMPIDGEQDDLPPTPVECRIDSLRA